MMNLSQETKVSQWGNSKAIRLPLAIVQSLGLNAEDKVKIGIDISADGVKHLVIDKIEPVPQSIDELFAGYNGGSFQAEVQEMIPEGNELW